MKEFGGDRPGGELLDAALDAAAHSLHAFPGPMDDVASAVDGFSADALRAIHHALRGVAAGGKDDAGNSEEQGGESAKRGFERWCHAEEIGTDAADGRLMFTRPRRCRPPQTGGYPFCKFATIRK